MPLLQSKCTHTNLYKNLLSNLLEERDFLPAVRSGEIGQFLMAGYQCDIYDGHIWKIYNSAEGLHFLCCPHRWLLTLNVDWFQPFELGIHSVGAISMCIQNLTGDVRYRSENIILVGIMPGPKEAKKTINSFLTPLVLNCKRLGTMLLVLCHHRIYL